MPIPTPLTRIAPQARRHSQRRAHGESRSETDNLNELRQYRKWLAGQTTARRERGHADLRISITMANWLVAVLYTLESMKLGRQDTSTTGTEVIR